MGTGSKCVLNRFLWAVAANLCRPAYAELLKQNKGTKSPRYDIERSVTLVAKL
jgi:hypothetical protein